MSKLPWFERQARITMRTCNRQMRVSHRQLIDMYTIGQRMMKTRDYESGFTHSFTKVKYSK